MRTRTVIIIGFMILFVIFGVSSLIQWELSQEIKNVSEYHRNMSIPAIQILNEIKLSFQMIHMLSIEMIQTDSTSEKYPKIQEGYQKDLVEFEEYVEKYSILADAKNSRGELFASQMMHEKMNNYVIEFQQIIQKNDVIIKQYQNGDISGSEALPLLAEIEDNFHKTIEADTQMEIRGMEKIQTQIIEIEETMATVFSMATAIAIFISVIVVILVSKFVSIPIRRLIEVTKMIANGESVELQNNSKNSDVNDMMKSLGIMSKELEIYKKRVVKQEKLSSIGELSSRLAHDIRNPLSVIKTSLEIIKARNDSSEEDLKKFKRIDEAIYRITHQIDNVLDFVKSKPLYISKHQLKDIINSSLRDIPKSKEIQTTDTDIEIKCDFELIKVVLINLIVNAIQSTGDNGKIKITTQKIDNNIIIQVEDNGPGIPEDELNEIFEPLFTTKQEGTGLGLASCKSIIEKHDGEISVKNNPTRFTIKLPQN